MREADPNLYTEQDSEFIGREVAKLFTVFAWELEEDNRRYFASQLTEGATAPVGLVNRGGTNASTPGPFGEPVEGSDSFVHVESPSPEPAPWETDRPLGGGEAQETKSSEVASAFLPPSTEPTNQFVDSNKMIDGKEQQPRLRLQGNIGRAPSFSFTTRGTPRITFPLATHDEQADGTKTTEWHSVYSTKNFAQAINAQELQRGEEVRVVGVRHQREKRGRDGKPLTDSNGEIQTEATVYAYCVKRVGEGK